MIKPEKRGVLLMNLGSPDSTRVGDVRRYLNQFLMDKRVMDMPYLSRLLLVKGIITPFRAPKSAEAYQTIWTKDGSPLLVITRQLQQALQEEIDEPVSIAMRYGKPSVKNGFEELLKINPELEEVIAVPLYPHYAMSSYETAVEEARAIHKKNKYAFKLRFIEPYYNDHLYIEALSTRIKEHLTEDYDHILFSYHGIPERHLLKTDATGCHCLQNENCCNNPSPAHQTCYRHQCFVTTELVTKRLSIPKEKFSISFQSRLGRNPWLKPYTDFRLADMPKEGIKKLLVVCPAFVSDCLETLEEIKERGKETFMEAGGKEYAMVPCLNAHPLWVGALKGLVARKVKGEA